MKTEYQQSFRPKGEGSKEPKEEEMGMKTKVTIFAVVVALAVVAGVVLLTIRSDKPSNADIKQAIRDKLESSNVKIENIKIEKMRWGNCTDIRCPLRVIALIETDASDGNKVLAYFDFKFFKNPGDYGKKWMVNTSDCMTSANQPKVMDTFVRTMSNNTN